MRDTPEHRFQAFVDRLIDRIVAEPKWTRGIENASKTTDNARARAAARGVKAGTPDVYVCQGAPTVSAWIELKRGKNTLKEGGAQEASLMSIRACGIGGWCCNTLEAVHVVLCRSGFRLVPGAANVVALISHELAAADREAALHKPRKAAQRKPRASAGKIRRAHAAGVWSP